MWVFQDERAGRSARSTGSTYHRSIAVCLCIHTQLTPKLTHARLLTHTLNPHPYTHTHAYTSSHMNSKAATLQTYSQQWWMRFSVTIFFIVLVTVGSDICFCTTSTSVCVCVWVVSSGCFCALATHSFVTCSLPIPWYE